MELVDELEELDGLDELLLDELETLDDLEELELTLLDEELFVLLLEELVFSIKDVSKDLLGVEKESGIE